MGPDTMTGGVGIWISGRCHVTVNDEPSPERAPGDASACPAVAAWSCAELVVVPAEGWLLPPPLQAASSNAAASPATAGNAVA
jgi:hypothetical protein